MEPQKNVPALPGSSVGLPFVNSFSMSTQSSTEHALVTPDVPPKEIAYRSLQRDESKVSNLVLSMKKPVSKRNPVSGMLSPTLVPRPAKTTERVHALPLMDDLTVPSEEAAPSSRRGRRYKPKPDGYTSSRLNKFVRRLHDMLQAEHASGIVEWRRGLLVLHSTDAFTKLILPKYFNTSNFKTFRRQLNYYGFVHVRSFSSTGDATTALWVNQTLAKEPSADTIASVLLLRRVDPGEDSKTAEGRRSRKEQAIHTVEEDIGVSPKTLQMEQIHNLSLQGKDEGQRHVLPAGVMRLPVPIAPAPAMLSDSASSSSSSHDGSEPSTVAGKKDGDCSDAASLLMLLAKGG